MEAPGAFALAGDGVELELERELYPVVGSTIAQLRATMARLGPRARGGPYAGYTRWELRWSYARTPREEGWTPTDVRVHARVVVSLPGWTPPRNAAGEVRAAWARFRAGLERHEDGHVALVLSGAHRVLAAVRALPVASSREALDAAAETAAGLAIGQLRELERAYDLDSDHGQTQGTAW